MELVREPGEELVAPSVRALWTSVAHAGRPIEHRGNVLEQLEPTVERAPVDQIEGDVGIPIEQAVLAGGAGDDWEDDDTETVHYAGLE